MTWGNPPPLEPSKPKQGKMSEIIPISKFIISRKQAKADGLLYYFTGQPCKHGHVCERLVSSCDCKMCHTAQSRDYGRKNIAKIVENFKIRTYGVSALEFGEMIASQNFKCLLCGDALNTGKEAHLDHCHSTGKIRGILCRNCNTGLGLFKDDIARLQQAINYLRKYDGLEQSSEIYTNSTKTGKENSATGFSSEWD